MFRIKAFPAAERSREKPLHAGPAALGDTELLALILRTGHTPPRPPLSNRPASC